MRVAVIAMLIGAACAAAACDNEDDDNLVGFPVLTLSGAFVLRSVAGDVLPAPLPDPANKNARVTALSGVISIFPSGVFRRVLAFERRRNGIDSTIATTCVGTWSAIGTSMSFIEKDSVFRRDSTGVVVGDTTSNCGGVFRGERVGEDLRATLFGVPVLYTR